MYYLAHNNSFWGPGGRQRKKVTKRDKNREERKGAKEGGRKSKRRLN